MENRFLGFSATPGSPSLCRRQGRLCHDSALLYSTLHGPKATLNSRLGLEKQFDHLTSYLKSLIIIRRRTGCLPLAHNGLCVGTAMPRPRCGPPRRPVPIHLGCYQKTNPARPASAGCGYSNVILRRFKKHCASHQINLPAGRSENSREGRWTIGSIPAYR